MGCSKRVSELITLSFAQLDSTTKYSMVRFGNVIGSSGSVVPLFIEQISKGQQNFTDKNENLILLHCVSAYPADISDVNLNVIQTLRNNFNIPVGYSDHTKGIEVAIAATALGASVIEKHFTLNKWRIG